MIYMDATFKVVPRLFYQLFTIFVNISGYVFPALFVLMTRKTTALYAAVFSKLRSIVSNFTPLRVMADFETASVRGLQTVYGSSVTVSGCWFHFTQAIGRRAKKLGLAESYRNQEDVRSCIRMMMCLPLLPSIDVQLGLNDIRTQGIATINNDDSKSKLTTLSMFIERQWILKTSIGPERISVVGCQERSNNGVESFHASLRRRVMVAHPNIFTFIKHLQNVSVDTVADVARVQRGLSIRRPKKKTAAANDKRIKQCIDRYSTGLYTRYVFLNTAGHAAQHLPESYMDDIEGSDDDNESSEVDQSDQPTASSSSVNSEQVSVSSEPQPLTCEVCLIEPQDPVALVPCGHTRFCRRCADELTRLGHRCPICRADISMVLQLFTSNRN